jgi:hypothetical protein
MIWLGIIDFFLLFLLLVGGTLFLIFLLFVFMAVSGYLAGKLVSKPWAIVYLVFLILLIIMRVIFLAIFYSILLTVLVILLILVDIYIATMVVRYIKLLNLISPEERQELRRWVALTC